MPGVLTLFILIYGLMNFTSVASSNRIHFNDATGCPNWCLMLSNLMIPASTMFLLLQVKWNKRSWRLLLCIALQQLFSSQFYEFLNQSDEFKIFPYYRSTQANEILLQSMSSSN